MFTLRRTLVLTLFVASLIGLGMLRADTPADLDALLAGVKEIAAPGVPGPLSVFGPAAFAVVVGKEDKAVQPVVAAARLGRGRVVAFGHSGYVDPETLAKADTGRLLTNALRWSSGKPAGPRVAVLDLPPLADWLRGQKFDATLLKTGGKSVSLEGFDALCLRTANVRSDELGSAVGEFVHRGGGLVCADLGWGWLQLNPGKRLDKDHPGNRLLAGSGIAWADGTLARTTPDGFSTASRPPALCHALAAWEALNNSRGKLSAADLQQAGATLLHAIRTVPAGDRLLVPQLSRALDKHAARVLPAAQRPLTAKDHPLQRVLLAYSMTHSDREPADKAKPHPASAEFPGSVPAGARPVTRKVAVDMAVPGWHSTGLYAAPGATVQVTLPATAIDKKLRLQIGCHADRLWNKDSWRRVPDVVRSVPVVQAQTHLANPFGGLVYVVAPDKASPGRIDVEVAGAVESPYFVLGQTDLQAWRKTLRHHPGPWAELATSKVILTVPSEGIRQLDDPQALMQFWDRVLDACAELSGRPKERPRPERYAADVQISVGYMHSGYPIMTHLDAVAPLTDLDVLSHSRVDPVWGLFHEMGHNHQSGDWTFSGAGEVTCNLFTLYVYDKVLGQRPNKWPRGPNPKRDKMIGDYLAAGARFDAWQSDPFLALAMYAQMEEGFGWEAFRKVFAAYRDLPPAQRPKTDDQRRDQWLVRFSRVVGKNLGPFFQAWGVPTSEPARASLADLPAWMPPDLPKR